MRFVPECGGWEAGWEDGWCAGVGALIGVVLLQFLLFVNSSRLVSSSMRASYLRLVAGGVRCVHAGTGGSCAVEVLLLQHIAKALCLAPQPVDAGLLTWEV